MYVCLEFNTFIDTVRLVVLFYGVSTLFGLFNAELSQFDMSLHVSRSSYRQICISTDFVYTQLNFKTVLFQATPFSISTLFLFDP